MKHIILFLSACFILQVNILQAQVIKLEKNRLLPVNVYMSIEKLMGKQVVKVIRDSTIKNADQPTHVIIKEIQFRDGIIEVNVLSRLLPNASAGARGFIGISFRINDDNSKFENIYIRPTNGRAEDQVRRNHSIQYFSYPDFAFDRLRKESPERYESYADMGLNEWINLRIEVKGEKARLFVNNSKEPSLIVNDLKHGPDLSGSIGFWVDGGTEGYFADLKIIRQ